MTEAAMARPVSVTGKASKIDGDRFRSALGRHAAGVVVVTAHPEQGPTG